MGDTDRRRFWLVTAFLAALVALGLAAGSSWADPGPGPAGSALIGIGGGLVLAGIMVVVRYSMLRRYGSPALAGADRDTRKCAEGLRTARAARNSSTNAATVVPCPVSTDSSCIRHIMQLSPLGASLET